MRVLHVINSLQIGGAERLISELCPELVTLGVKIDVLILKNTSSEFLTKIKKDKRINILESGISNIYNPLNIIKLYKYIKGYDILHVHLFPSLYWVFFANCLLMNKRRFVYTEHSTYNRRRDNFILKYFDKLIYKRIDKVISISNDTQKNLLRFLKVEKSKKFVVVNNGVNLDTFRPIKTNEGVVNRYLNGEPVYLLQVSSFSESKDQKTVIESLRFLPKNVFVKFAGIGPKMPLYKDLTNNLGLCDRVEFLGLRKDLEILYSECDVVVQSSNWEGFGLTAVEGMACGKPVIASNVRGLSEIVRGYGILFEPLNSKELSEKIEGILSNEQIYREITNRCHERAKSFSLKLMAEKYLKTYESLF